MTQGFPAQPQYGQQMPPQQFAQPMQGYAPPAQPQYQQPAAPQQGGFFQTQDPYIQAQQGPAAAPMTNNGAPQQTDTAGFWGGAPSLSFDDKKGYVKGTFRGGQVISKSISDQTDMATKRVRTWPDGTPRKQLVVVLQTTERSDPSDNGQRQMFIKGDAVRATREALQAAGTGDIEIGAWVYFAWVDEKAPSTPGFNPYKLFKVVYARPGQPDPMPAPVQVAQPAMPQPGQVIAQMPMPVQAYPGQGPAPMPQQAAPQMDPNQAAQFAAWQAQQAGAQPQNPPGQFPAQPQPDPSGQQPGQWTPFSS